MANISKRSFFSSLFGNKKHKEDEEAAELESRHRLEERIQQVLAERGVVHDLLMEEKKAALIMRDPEPEPEPETEAEVELFPISASALRARKAPVGDPFFPTNVQEVRAYAANERW